MTEAQAWSGFDEERLLERWLGPAASVAIWDVTTMEAWSDYIGQTVMRVPGPLHFRQTARRRGPSLWYLVSTGVMGR